MRDRDPFGPACLIDQPNNAASDRWSTTVGGGRNYGAGDVLARPPARRAHRQQTQLAAVDRNGAHGNDGFVGRRRRFFDLSQLQRGRGVGGTGCD
jgi:hypothetical protein